MFAIDPDKDLVDMPPPQGIGVLSYPAFSDFRCEQRAEPVPPITNCFVTDIDAPFEEEVFDVAKLQWISHVHKNGETNDLW